MRTFLPVALALVIAASSSRADDKPDNSTKVTGTITIPKDVKAFSKLVLEVRLYEYDPRIADKAADLVDILIVKDFTHVEGKEEVEKIELGAKAKIAAGKSYYVTVFVLDGETRTHMAELDHAKGNLGKVLTNGAPREIKGTLKSLKK